MDAGRDKRRRWCDGFFVYQDLEVVRRRLELFAPHALVDL